MKHIKVPRQAWWPMPLVIIMATLAGSHSLPALELEKMLAFATADSVRIELAPSAGEDFAGVEFQAAITQAGTGRLLWQGSLGQGAPDAARGACFSKAISGLKPELWSPSSPFSTTSRSPRPGTERRWPPGLFAWASVPSRFGAASSV